MNIILNVRTFFLLTSFVLIPLLSTSAQGSVAPEKEINELIRVKSTLEHELETLKAEMEALVKIRLLKEQAADASLRLRMNQALAQAETQDEMNAAGNIFNSYHRMLEQPEEELLPVIQAKKARLAIINQRIEKLQSSTATETATAAAGTATAAAPASAQTKK